MSELSVAIIVPVLNEEKHLAEVYEAIKMQSYKNITSIVFSLGPSTDNTNSVAKSLASVDSRIILVDNPTGKTPTAMNLGIANSTSDVVVRCDGHALLPANYVDRCVQLLIEKGAVNVGGRMFAQGDDAFTRAVAWAMTSSWGVGKAAFHVGGESGESDTVYLGAFRRSALVEAGGYDEDMIRAQDWELNYRLRKNGGVIWFDPDLKVIYRPRNSIKALASQYFQYGQWRRRVMRMYPETIQSGLRYLAPPLLVITLILSLVLPQIGYLLDLPLLMLSAFAPMLYVCALALISLGAVLKKQIKPQSFLTLILILLTMHISWGTGFLVSKK
jgi:glycosyltransferase involved in cell wall biosynthesis